MKNKWTVVCADGDYNESKRVIEGQLTPRRLRLIMQYVAKYNTDNATPYGVSPQGYAYRCGCSHDCCGCLISDRIEMAVPESNKVELKMVTTYNL